MGGPIGPLVDECFGGVASLLSTLVAYCSVRCNQVFLGASAESYRFNDFEVPGWTRVTGARRKTMIGCASSVGGAAVFGEAPDRPCRGEFRDDWSYTCRKVCAVKRPLSQDAVRYRLAVRSLAADSWAGRAGLG